MQDSLQICDFSNVDLFIIAFMTVVIMMTLVTAVTLVDVMIFVAVVESYCDDCIM